MFTQGSGMPADGDIAPTESLLRYVVRFQNTGNDTAFNIFVRDTLDVAHLDLGTFRVLGSSHAHSVTMSPNGQVEFFFPNILLPDSGRNQLASNGMFQFQIGIKPGMPLGTVIPNSVSIYFDNNAPVKTNTTQTRLCDVLQSAAGFSANGLSVQFNNQTTGAVNSRLWDFGDGSTSTLLHPNHTYAAPGTYNVCLISNGACRSDTQCLSINVCTSPPTSGFNPSFTGLTAAFNNTSLNAVSYEWDFGDGGTATVATPTHAYLAIGNYNVCLVTTSSCGDKDTLCSTITVCTNPIASMSLANGGNGNLSFTDHSQHTVSWSWDFGDGGTSSLQNPTHQYQNDGNYTICLIVQSSCGADTVCNIVSVCGIPVVAAFSESIVGLNVNFSGNSTNTSTYSWDFGDGSPVVTGANPSHSYAAIGNYLVCMNSASACGTVDSICRLITVCIPPVAGFNPVNAGAGNFNFVDFSTHANSWFWDFGNGDTSHQQSPSYQFVSNGVYTVCLTTTNLCGLDSACTTMSICPETLEAAFSANGNQFTYNFTDLSQGGLQYFWDFGDGFTSNATSPSHTYASNGVYNVCLQVTNLCGNVDSTCQTQTVSVVGVHSPISGFEILVMPNPMDHQTLVQVQHPNAFGEYQFHLYDSKGALVRSQIGEFNKALRVPRENLSDGLYFYRIHQQGTELGSGRILMRGE
jgi:PKD repeat protein